MGAKTKSELRLPPGVRIASDSSFEIDFRYRGVRCRERKKLPINQRNANYCGNLKGRIEDEIAKNEFIYSKHFPHSKRARRIAALPGDSVLVKSHLEEWLTREKPHIQHSTLRGYQKVLKYHLVPAFGDLSLCELRQKHVMDWEDEHSDLASKTKRNILSPLRIALDDAVRRELIDTNPLDGLKLRRRRNGKPKDPDPFSSEERGAILSVLEGQACNFVQFAFWTGLRTSELCALDWTDIDWVRGVMVVSRALTQGMDEPEEGTKTEAGARVVKLLAPALEALAAQKPFTFDNREEIFQDPRYCERWTGDAPIREKMWKPGLKRAGVRYRKPYQTRHTYASMMLMAREHVMWVSKQMGHTDPAFTLKTYSRWIPSDMPDAGEKAVAQWSTSSLSGR